MTTRIPLAFALLSLLACGSAASLSAGTYLGAVTGSGTSNCAVSPDAGLATLTIVSAGAGGGFLVTLDATQCGAVKLTESGGSFSNVVGLNGCGFQLSPTSTSSVTGIFSVPQCTLSGSFTRQ
jgi:hypothetical protein